MDIVKRDNLVLGATSVGGAARGTSLRTRRMPRFNLRGTSDWEPFEDRGARARSLPADYATGWAQHISDIIDADSEARYYPFAFWTTAAWGASPEQMARRIQRACQMATCDMFPTLPRSSLNRIPLRLSVAAIVLPAQKRDGVPTPTGSSGCRLRR